MPRVPSLEPRVQYQTPNIPAPQVGRVPEAAFGGDIAQANQNLGAQIQKSANVLGDHVIDMKKKESEAFASKSLADFRADVNLALTDPTIDPETKKPKGLLLRKLDDAKEITLEYNKVKEDLGKKWLSVPVSYNMKNAYDEAIRSGLDSTHNQVASHEASQIDASDKIKFESFKKSSVASAGGIANPADLINHIDANEKFLASASPMKGVDPKVVESEAKFLNAQQAASAVDGVLETNPKQAMKLLESVRDKMYEGDYNKIKKTIDGKLMYEKQQAVWDVAKQFKHADGTMDYSRVEKFAMSTEGTAEQKKQMADTMRSFAAAEDARLADQIKASDRSFANDLVKLHAEGGSIDEAFVMATKYGRDISDVANKQNTVKELFAGKTSRYDTWLNSMPEEYKNASDEAESLFKATYPKKKKVAIAGLPEKIEGAEAAMNEFKLQAMGKSPAQMRELANNMTKDVVVKPGHFWDTEEVSWKVSYEDRLSLDQAWAALDNKFGAKRVALAKNILRKQGKSISPINVSDAISIADSWADVQKSMAQSEGAQ